MKTRPKRALLAVGALATVVGLALAVAGLMGLGCELVVQLDPALVDAGEPDALYAEEDESQDAGAGADVGADAAPKETGAESATGDASADAPTDSTSDSPGDDGGGGDGATADASGADSTSE